MTTPSANIGEVYVSVVPDARGFTGKVDRQLSPQARELGRSVGADISRQIVREVTPSVRDAIAAASGPARAQGAKTGEEFGGSFATTAKTRIDAAFRALPKAKIGTDATHLDAELVAIRARLEALSDVHVGVDLDAAAAVAEIELVKERLVSLAARSPHIDVKVDAARAIAELAAVGAAVDTVGASPSSGGGLLSGLGSGVAGLAGSISAAGVAMGALVLAAIPLAAVLTGVVASAALLASILGGVAIAAAVGLVPIVKALSALNAADKQSTASAATTAAARVNSAEAVRSATASLANTIANADSAAIRSAQAVKDARTGLADAERSAAQGITRALGAQAAAEGALAAAQRTARDAVASLTQARKDAQQQIEDLARATKHAALDERQGVLSVEEARQRLQEVNANPLATATDRQQAKLDYDEAVQQLDDIRAKNTDLAATKAAADAAGVEGSKGVLAAQQNLADATARVSQAQDGVAKAAADLAEARRSGAESVARAEQAVTTALRAQKDQARASAFSIAQASAALASAQRAQKQALAGTSSAAATAKAALAGLSPAGRAFVKFLHDEFLPALGQVSRAATDGLVGGLMRGMTALEPLLPVIAVGMGRLATAAGDFFAAAAQGLASPFWARFFDFLTGLTGPAGKAASTILGDLARGFAGLLEAFAPFAQQIAGGLASLAARFAAFGASAGKGGSLDRFLTFLHDKGPGIASDLGAIATAVGHVIVAAAPIGVVVATAFGALSRVISDIPIPVLTVVLGLITATAAAMVVLAIATAIVESPVLLVVAAIALLIIGLTEAWKHSETFRRVVTTAFDVVRDDAAKVGAAFAGIKDAATTSATWVSDKFDALVGFFAKLPDRITTAATGMFDGIKDAFRSAINFVIDAWNGLDFSIGIPKSAFGIPIPGGGHSIDIGTPNIDPIGARALGGSVAAGAAYVVGERGPELFFPGRSGYVASHADSMAALLAATSQDLARNSLGSSGGKASTVIEHFEQHNHHPAQAYTDPREAMMRLQWELSG